VAVVSDLDHAELRRQRRELRRRQVRRRRLTALAVLAVLAAAAVFGLVRLVAGATAGATSAFLQPVAAAMPHTTFRRATPEEIRGIHVTGPLMSVPGRFASYLALTKQGLNTVEVDLKDESGNVSFVRGAPALARRDGAARAYFDPARVARQAHEAGVYLIGRVVTFEDPITATAHPELAIHGADGSLWHTAGGLAWLNPYNRTAWKYDVDVAVRAARAGFDEIQFDYVRFPSDGDVASIRYPGAHPQPMRETIPAFLRYARSRLHPLGVRISADVFGLSAAHDLGIGQLPAQIGGIVDAIYPMTYPSHYTPGEYNLANPNAAPGATVLFSLQDFRNRLPVGGAVLVPWLQDFSLYRRYTPRDVAAQVQSARSMHTGGFMLWNAGGVYTTKELHPAAKPAGLPVLPAPQL
jgi:hypothetical protein